MAGGPVSALICGLWLYELVVLLLVSELMWLKWRDPPRNPDGGALPLYAVLLYCSIRPLPGLAIWWGAS